MRILIVEDEVRIAKALREILVESNYICDIVLDGEDGLRYALEGQYDCIILDVMLPGISGIRVAESLRASRIATPILMLTAKAGISDKVQGLDSGADDYLTKPFSPEELLARVRALTRRPSDILSQELTFGDLRLDLATHTLHCAAKSIRLRFKEFEILRILMTAFGQVTSKETLIQKAWDNTGVEDNSVEAYISFLRKKLFYVGSVVGIKSIRKVGYQLEEEP